MIKRMRSYRFSFLILFVLLVFASCTATESREWVFNNFNFTYNTVADTVYTIRGNPNPAVKWVSGGNFDKDQSDQLHDRAKQQCPGIIVWGPANVAYNCHSHAWYNMGQTNLHWIDNPYQFRADSNYITSTAFGAARPSSVSIGDKVDFYNSSNDRPHSARVFSNTTFISKWGVSGLYEHTPTNVPSIYVCSQFGYYR